MAPKHKKEYHDDAHVYHYTTAANLDKIQESGYIKNSSRFHARWSGIPSKGVCVTNAHDRAPTDYLKYQTFKNGRDEQHLDAYVKIPVKTLQSAGYKVLRYKEDKTRRDYLIVKDDGPVKLDEIAGCSFNLRGQ